ncbi:hypothetical protein [Achromobacter sp. MYb9]|uniref:dual OB domain-containing protein n=1 Tax=Achromobacter sp. MYb9 TaxID=1827284 RepID=UPI0011B21779|nr:hypothetical protein [Achromobacter sp. MYb9]
METIVITDVTRFKLKDNKICVAGLTLDGKTCIRPMVPTSSHPDYLSHDDCRKNNILPGMVVRGDFHLPNQVSAPHHEDRLHNSLENTGPLSAGDFERLLKKSLSKSVRDGFGITSTEKVVKVDERPARSIITIQPRAGTVRIVQDGYNESRIRIHFTDQSGAEYSFLSITDLGLYDFVGDPEKRKMSIGDVNAILNGLNRVYLRVGLSRVHTVGERTGYWLQVNGVYSFPQYSEIIRSY